MAGQDVLVFRRIRNVEMDDGNNEKRIEKIRNEEVGARAGVANTSENIREMSLIW